MATTKGIVAVVLLTVGAGWLERGNAGSDPCEAMNKASGMYANCLADQGLDGDRKQRQDKWAALREAQPAKVRHLVDRLRDKSAAFAAKRAEVAAMPSAGGTAHGSFVSGAQNALEEAILNRFVKMTDSSDKGAPGDVAAADAALNVAYKKAKTLCKETAADWGDRFAFGRSCDQLVVMQRAWILYRDAAVSFINESRPPSERASAQARLVTELALDQAQFLRECEFE